MEVFRLEYIFLFSILLFALIIYSYARFRKKNTLGLKSEKHYLTKYEEFEYAEDEDYELLVKADSILYKPVHVENIDTYKELELNKEMLKDIAYSVKSLGTKTLPRLINDWNAYEISLSPEVRRKIKDGSLSLMKSKGNDYFVRGMVVDNNKKIVEVANFKKLNPLQLRKVAFNLATVIVAQEHMREIRKSLNQLRGAIDRLINLKLNEYRGQAESSFYYLDRVHLFLQEEKMNTKIEYQLETNYKNDIDLLYSLLLNLDEPIKKIQNLKRRPFVFKEGTSINDFKKIIREFQDYEELIYMFLLSTKGAIHAMRLLGDPESTVKQANERLLKANTEFESKRKKFIDEIANYENDFNVRLSSDSRERKQKRILTENRLALQKVSSEKCLDMQNTLSIEPPSIFIVANNNEVKVITK